MSRKNMSATHLAFKTFRRTGGMQWGNVFGGAIDTQHATKRTWPIRLVTALQIINFSAFLPDTESMRSEDKLCTVPRVLTLCASTLERHICNSMARNSRRTPSWLSLCLSILLVTAFVPAGEHSGDEQVEVD
jgi:hypothetical protein